jgi:hypothetical protein
MQEDDIDWGYFLTPELFCSRDFMSQAQSLMSIWQEGVKWLPLTHEQILMPMFTVRNPCFRGWTADQHLFSR